MTKKNGKTSFGYKAHIGTDEGSGLIRRAVMTTAQIHDSQAGDALVQVRALLERFIQISHEQPMIYQLAWRRNLSLRADPQNVTRILEYLSQLIQLCIEREQCIERDPTLAATMAFSLVNGTLMLNHSLPALGQTDQAKLEREMIAASITYLTK